MDRLKKSRSVVRSTFTKVFHGLEDILKAEEQDVVKLQAQFEILESKHEELKGLDNQINEEMLASDATEEDMVIDINKADEYTTLFNEVKIKVNKVIKSCNDLESNCSNGTYHSQVSVGRVSQVVNSQQRKFKLPFLELKKFDGNLINWLQFWAQFSKIHNDSDIANEDKFQYLLQSIEPKTRAYDLVSSFPPTGKNYENAVEGLKSRFGKEELLVEVYVRELLKLVLQNVLNKESKMPLQSLYDKLESYLRAIDSLGITTDKCAAMLFPLVESCMPEDLLRAWQRSSFQVGGEAKSRLDSLMKFMLSEVEGEQRIGLAMSSFGFEDYGSKPRLPKKGTTNPVFSKRFAETPSAANLVSTGTVRPKVNAPLLCVFCDKNHKSQDCFAAQKMSLDERRRILNEKSACYGCLRLGHCIKDCKGYVKCVLCKKKHFLLMCSRFQLRPSEKNETSPSAATNSSQTDQVMLEQSNELANKSTEVGLTSNVLMQTVLVDVSNPQNGMVRQARVLFDSGSQQSYVSAELAKVMGYTPLGRQTIVHTLFGNVQSKEQVHSLYRLNLGGKSNPYTFEIDVLDQPAICGKVPHVPPGPWLKELAENQIVLTDVEVTNLPIQILIGADVMGKLLTGDRFELSCGLVAIETRLGWTLMGRINKKSRDCGMTKTLISMFVNEAEISELWCLDSLGIRDPYEHQSKQDKNVAIQNEFLNSTKINEEHRYEVELPWVDGHVPLPSNKAIAETRLSALLKKLEKENMYEDYNDVFKQWQEEKIVEKVPEDEIENVGHYLPHKPVIKEGNSTTRIRPVFDASAHEIRKPSLNDCLERGPNTIELIPSVMMRFREGQFGVVADIRKAFLQISIDPQDRDFLRFIWYDKEKAKFEIYRHRRVVFGLKCSPFLLGAVIDLHLQKVSESCDETKLDLTEKLRKSFYVDNVSTSFDSLEEVQGFVEYATKVMAAGKFDLRSWETTNSCSDEKSVSSNNVNVLGIYWDIKNDSLSINTDFLKEFNLLPLTKRKILSIAHRIFDPIGYVSPVTLCPKLILQKTWKKEIGWDTEVDEDILKEFLEWFKYLPCLEEIKIPRWIGKTITQNDNCSLHTFCDGSKGAYATVVYLRVVTENGVNVQLVAAKSRVVPLKKISIPRIELLAATVGARLTKSVKNAMNWTDMTSYFWTDSTTVLAWIKQENKWKVFVQNRVTEIKKLTQVEEWNFVPGELNPADLPSRGCNAKHLLESKWYEGPDWLKNEKDICPKFNYDVNNNEVFEEMTKSDFSKTLGCLVQDNLDEKQKVTDWCTYFSQYLKIVRSVAWVYRFIQNCKIQNDLREKGELTVNEIQDAEHYLFKQIQAETLNGISDKKIASLNPILDENGLIRLETKLCNKKDSYGFRYPIVLSPEHKIVKSLVVYYHEKNCHAGVQVLLSILRESYWILGGRKAIRSIISKCVTCKRQKGRKLEAQPGMLPADRLREAVVFEIVGIDFAGPIYLKNNQKAWICLYTCAVYRAIHLELVTSLSTDAFLQAFRRFIARRGRPHVIYSDNGTNFVGTSRALKGIDWEEIRKYSSAQRIDWKFNPPTAAWWGGWWERLVRLTKELLRRVLGKACLTYQEMTTVLCDCESVINSRPLTYLYESEAELIALTPNHFLHDLKDSGVPDIDRIEELSLNKRQKYTQSVRKDLRQRFRIEYLGQLVQKSKHNKKYEKINVGDLVLMELPNKKRLDWPLALVIEKLPDKKGVSRLVRIKTSNGILLRPIQKLYQLEVAAKEDQLQFESKHRKCKMARNPKRTVK